MTNCGRPGWVSDQEGSYRYQATHPVTGEAWPPVPVSVLNPGAKMVEPISQSASMTVCPSAHCLTIEPNTSDIDSCKAPD
jgi:hypothetical protein